VSAIFLVGMVLGVLSLSEYFRVRPQLRLVARFSELSRLPARLNWWWIWQLLCWESSRSQV
jgi:hypothetical protein